MHQVTSERHGHHDHQGHKGNHAHRSPGHSAEAQRTHHTHGFDPEHAEGLLSEKRSRMTPAGPILRAAGIDGGQVVVDLGAGPGFFTLPAARLVGSGGSVYAVDVQQGMLEVCQRRAAEAGITWIDTVRSEESRVPLPDATADRVVIAFVLHEANDPAALLREAVRLLRPDGEVAVVESPKIEGTPGPPMEHRIGEDELAVLAAQVGLSASSAGQRGAMYYVSRLRRVRQ